MCTVYVYVYMQCVQYNIIQCIAMFMYICNVYSICIYAMCTVNVYMQCVQYAMCTVYVYMQCVQYIQCIAMFTV